MQGEASREGRPGQARRVALSRSQRAGNIYEREGAVAQLVERLLCKQDVVGSNPFGSTNREKKKLPKPKAFDNGS